MQNVLRTVVNQKFPFLSLFAKAFLPAIAFASQDELCCVPCMLRLHILCIKNHSRVFSLHCIPDAVNYCPNSNLLAIALAFAFETLRGRLARLLRRG